MQLPEFVDDEIEVMALLGDVRLLHIEVEEDDEGDVLLMLFVDDDVVVKV
ncbi:MAG: hypothetical protein J6T10_19960 [Methanobrevibacter sp.]|nr:hypothetical protein [Methanobrevibacter sp.]MBO7694898.1 hypothetical protein [Methanobrevibacter sp.]